ncbi:hypothetical protein [Clostridium sp. UBA1652]|uniref:hypothetical protein n=1 Tax=Clostridium sp. UBA1652 TaxID=1946348 RepID=UPI00257D0107|nr:hypothetical protein [Clostridium sp. UBA1652]
MNTKKTLIKFIVVTILISVCIVTGVKYLKNEQNQKNKEDTFFNEEANIKDDEAYVEELVTSLSSILKNMVNNKDADLSYLNDIVNNNSDAYNILENKIKIYREKNITIEYLDYYIDEIEKIEHNTYKIYITEDEGINSNSNSEKMKKNIEIKLKLDDDRGIYYYKEK